MIGDSEKNTVHFSALLPEVAPKTYKGLIEILDRYGVRHSLLNDTRDIWCKDYMPVQTAWDTPEGGHFEAFLYEPDYLTECKKYSNSITDGALVFRSHIKGGVLNRHPGIRLDGGNVVGMKGRCIMTMKVFEDNPGTDVVKLSAELEKALGARITFLPWDRADIYGHSDGIARFTPDGSVIMTNYSQIDPKMAKAYRKILDAEFGTVHELHYNVERLCRYSWAYINWLQTEQVLILPRFNTPEDLQALRQVEEWMPQYRGRIEMVDATDLIVHGGGLNCISWAIAPVKPRYISGDQTKELEDAVFPCYGVTVRYSDGRVVHVDYPEGMEDPFPELDFL